ncbi:hypothetical protein U9M48_008118 [Paspalum notatum var. saurae]|uniref:Peptidase M50 domain-containing protein n=1 Tax=Paspalum notatum var. saurae TaxID=547442 RepID=A0AAQ3WD08_PASNO
MAPRCPRLVLIRGNRLPAAASHGVLLAGASRSPPRGYGAGSTRARPLLQGSGRGWREWSFDTSRLPPRAGHLLPPRRIQRLPCKGARIRPLLPTAMRPTWRREGRMASAQGRRWMWRFEGLIEFFHNLSVMSLYLFGLLSGPHRPRGSAAAPLCFVIGASGPCSLLGHLLLLPLSPLPLLRSYRPCYGSALLSYCPLPLRHDHSSWAALVAFLFFAFFDGFPSTCAVFPCVLAAGLALALSCVWPFHLYFSVLSVYSAPGRKGSLPRRSKPNPTPLRLYPASHIAAPAQHPILPQVPTPPLPLTPLTTAPANSEAARRCPPKLGMAAALASSPLVHLTSSRLRFPSVLTSAPGCLRGGVCLGWRLTVGWRAARRCDRVRCFSTEGGDGDEGEKRSEEEASAAAEAKVGAAEDLGSERSRSGSFSSSSSTTGTPGVSSDPPLLSFSVDNIDTVKLLELLGPEKVDPADVKAIKDKLFGYTTFWLTREEPFGDLGEGVLFIGNLRGKREEIFAKLQRQLRELTGDKYNLFMVEEPNSEGDDPRGGPRVSFGLLRKEVSEPGPTTLWQYVISLLLFLLTMFSCVELGIASKISSLPPEIVSYFTDPNATGPPPDMQLLLPFVESALPVAYGVLAIQLFHEIGHFLAAFPKNVKLSIPFFIPNFTLGTFGAITQFKSILPDRKTMFDVSMAGPVAGAALSFSMFFVGLLLSSNPVGASDLVEVPSQLFQGSLLLGLISRATLGYRAMHAATVSIHPLVIAGWCGLTTTAFNMLPVGCLDGGRALQGAFGKDALFGFGLTTYSLLGLGVLGGPLSLPWGLYVLICQRTPEKPCLNDVSDVGTWRRAALIASVFLVVLTLIPLWDELAEDLGVGLVTTF